MHPSYLDMFNSGRLKETAEQAINKLGECGICPRKCGVNRLKGNIGYCRTGRNAKVYSYMCHRGEEPPISGTAGSGTIFFSNCNMGCVYCQNYTFSQKGQGREVKTEELASLMLELQEMKCHNINLVTPTHVMPQILEALDIACSKGLAIPIVYNTGGYESAQILKFLEGIVDIYLADMRYGGDKNARIYSGAEQYSQFNRDSVKEMHRQVGIAQTDSHGIILKGLIIRHMVLPGGLSGTEEVMKFIAEEVSTETFISLMSQYNPYYKAGEFKEISRRLTKEEYADAISIMERYSLHNGWLQDDGGLERFAGTNIKQA